MDPTPSTYSTHLETSAKRILSQISENDPQIQQIALNILSGEKPNISKALNFLVSFESEPRVTNCVKIILGFSDEFIESLLPFLATENLYEELSLFDSLKDFSTRSDVLKAIGYLPRNQHTPENINTIITCFRDIADQKKKRCHLGCYTLDT